MSNQRTYIDEPPYVDFQFLLPLHAHTLTILTDGAFIVPFVAKVRRRLREGANRGVIFKPTTVGAAQFAAELAIDSYFESMMDFLAREGDRGYYNVFRLLRSLKVAWFTVGGSRLIDGYSKQLADLEVSAGTANPDLWCDIAIQKAGPLLERMAMSCRRSADYVPLREAYAAALSDRLLHDRQVCAHLAALLVRLAPIGCDGVPRRFVRRAKNPAWVRRIVMARDRGKCACCGTDIAIELRAEPHIDHIIPLAEGGCNDVVNLQLLCDRCNLRKAARIIEITSSVPRYQGRYLPGHSYEDGFP